MNEELINRAKELLESKEISLLIGFEEKMGRTQPCFIKSENETSRLIFSEQCHNNLAVYLPRIKERVGIVAKPCDVKSIIGLIAENQVKRENIVIIGMVCKGIKQRLVGRGQKAEGNGHKEARLLPKCQACNQKTPVVYDILIREEKEERENLGNEDRFSALIEFENMSVEQRWQYWLDQMKRCIRCYACRAACPLCYCPRCFADVTTPPWVHASVSVKNNIFFHIIRTIHLAGRCIDCGECERACPMNIPLSLLNLKMAKDVEELFNYTPGIDMLAKPPLQEFKKDDNNGCIG